MNFLKSLAVGAIAAFACATASVAGTLTVSLNVDNDFTAYISTDNSAAGTSFLMGNHWYTNYSATTALQNGVTNYLHIAASNRAAKSVADGGKGEWGTHNQAGLIGTVSLTGTGFAFANGATSMKTGDGLFNVSDSGWSNYVAASEHTFGTRKYERANGAPTDASWLWTSERYTDQFAYFSVAIFSTPPQAIPVSRQAQVNPVPLPAGFALLLAGVGAFGVAKRRQSKG